MINCDNQASKKIQPYLGNNERFIIGKDQWQIYQKILFFFHVMESLNKVRDGAPIMTLIHFDQGIFIT